MGGGGRRRYGITKQLACVVAAGGCDERGGHNLDGARSGRHRKSYMIIIHNNNTASTATRVPTYVLSLSEMI